MVHEVLSQYFVNVHRGGTLRPQRAHVVLISPWHWPAGGACVRTGWCIWAKARGPNSAPYLKNLKIAVIQSAAETTGYPGHSEVISE